MTDPGDQYPSSVKPVMKIDDFKMIFNQTVIKSAEKLIETNFAEQ